jgi:hypothetical protein
MPSSGRLRRVALVRTDVSEEYIAFIIRVTRISEPGTALAVTSNRSKLRRNTKTAFFAVPAAKISNLTLSNTVRNFHYLSILQLLKRTLVSVRFEVFTAVTMKNGVF